MNDENGNSNLIFFLFCALILFFGFLNKEKIIVFFRNNFQKIHLRNNNSRINSKESSQNKKKRNSRQNSSKKNSSSYDLTEKVNEIDDDLFDNSRYQKKRNSRQDSLEEFSYLRSSSKKISEMDDDYFYRRKAKKDYQKEEKDEKGIFSYIFGSIFAILNGVKNFIFTIIKYIITLFFSLTGMIVVDILFTILKILISIYVVSLALRRFDGFFGLHLNNYLFGFIVRKISDYIRSFSNGSNNNFVRAIAGFVKRALFFIFHVDEQPENGNPSLQQDGESQQPPQQVQQGQPPQQQNGNFINIFRNFFNNSNPPQEQGQSQPPQQGFLQNILNRIGFGNSSNEGNYIENAMNLNNQIQNIINRQE